MSEASATVSTNTVVSASTMNTVAPTQSATASTSAGTSMESDQKSEMADVTSMKRKKKASKKKHASAKKPKKTDVDSESSTKTAAAEKPKSKKPRKTKKRQPSKRRSPSPFGGQNLENLFPARGHVERLLANREGFHWSSGSSAQHLRHPPLPPFQPVRDTIRPQCSTPTPSDSRQTLQKEVEFAALRRTQFRNPNQPRPTIEDNRCSFNFADNS